MFKICSPPFTLPEHTLFQFPSFLVLIHVTSFCLVPKCLVYFTSIHPPDSGLKVVSKITFLINFMSKLPSGSIQVLQQKFYTKFPNLLLSLIPHTPLPFSRQYSYSSTASLHFSISSPWFPSLEFTSFQLCLTNSITYNRTMKLL